MDWVHSVAFTPDGKQCLTGSRDKTMRLWETATGKLVRQMDGNGWVESIAVAKDGTAR
jgi:WD40 repeat protein